MKRILICGGAGFIGRNLVETLSARDDLDVHATFHGTPAYGAEITWHHADLRNPVSVDKLLAHRFDIVIQAAAVTSGSKDICERPWLHVTDNAVMNAVLLRACHDHAVEHFIFFSCGVMYPSRVQPWLEHEWRETMAIHPRYFGVAWTKIYIEKMCEFYASLGKMRCTVLRNSNIYGHHDKFDDRGHVFSSLVRKALTKDVIEIWGDGSEARDLLHVADLVRLVERVMERSGYPFKRYHAASGQAITVTELANAIMDASGRRRPISYDPKGPTIDHSLSLSFAKAHEELGWSPRIRLADGIRSTIEHFTGAHAA